MSQLRESFVNLTVTRGYGKRKGEKDLTKLTHQVYIYAIPYLWAFPRTSRSSAPRRSCRATCGAPAATPSTRRSRTISGGPDGGELRGQRPRRAHRDPDGRRQLCGRGPGLQRRIVKDGKLASPSRNALPGITRKTVFELADAMGIEATLRDVTSHELYDADELMAVTTAGGVTPINTLDGETAR